MSKLDHHCYLYALCLLPVMVAADVVRDGSIGPGAGTQPSGPDFVIDETMGSLNGTNLFHSFSQFDLTASQSATFTATSAIDNVISRITGGTPSSIDGVINSAIPGANVFLINPAGMVFGPNAQVNVDGSFYVSTADYLKFANNEQFVANPALPLVLSSTVPSAFGFLNAPLGNITFNQAQLSVSSTEAIGVVGGDITIEDDGNFAGFTDPTFIAANGLVHLEAVASSGEVAVNNAAVPGLTATTANANITLTDSFINVSGTAAGEIAIKGNNVTISNSWLHSNNIGNANAPGVQINAQQFIGQGTGGIQSSTSQLGNGGDLEINATNIDIRDNFALIVTSEALANGRAGDIRLNATADINLSTTFASVNVLTTSSLGAGHAGDIFINAQNLTLDQVGILTSTLVSGDSGDININVQNFTLQNGGRLLATNHGTGAGGIINLNVTDTLRVTGPVEPEIADIISTETFSTGPAGDISIVTPNLIVDEAEIKASTKNAGNAGSVDIQSDTISLINGGQISATTQFGGQGGVINIAASEAMTINGSDADGYSSGVFTESRITSTGDAGQITITTPVLNMLGDGAIYSSTLGAGSGGNINLNVQTLNMSGGELNARTTGTGQGGSVVLQVDQLLMNNAALVSASSTGTGNAGSIAVTGANSIQIQNNSAITTESALSNGGNITLQSQQNIIARDADITANVNDGTGGNINVTSDLVVLDNSRLVAQAGAGQGGAIAITAKHYFNGESLVSASAGPAGIAGSVDINAPDIDLSNSLSRLETRFVDVASLINSVCTAHNRNTQSRFVVSSRRGLPSLVEGIPVALAASGTIQLDVAGQQHYGNAGIIRQLNQARDAIEQQDANAIALLAAAQQQVNALEAGVDKIYTQIYLANSYAQLAQKNENLKQQSLLLANNLFEQLKLSSTVQADNRAASFVLGNQALLYKNQQRLDEALYLLRQTEDTAQQANAPEALYLWYWHEGKILWAQGKTQAAVNAWQRAIDVLDATRQDALVRNSDDARYFHTQIAPVYRDLVDALLRAASLLSNQDQIDALLYRTRSVLERFKAAELRNYFLDPCISERDQKTVMLDQVQDDAAIIYPIILPDRIELLVSLKSGIHRFSVAVDENNVRAHIRRFRMALQQPDSTSHLRYGNQLYQWLVQPYKEFLAENKIKTLVFVMDGPLRTIPMAALYDGKEYLISEYALAVSVGLNLIEPQPLHKQNAHLLMAGLSESVEGFPELPYVPAELNSLQQLFGGEKLLDQTFSLNQFQARLDADKPSMVHLASHAKFSSDAQSSFLLAYDGRITLDRMAAYIGARNQQEKPLELLVLSACETAAGDDRAALGLAGVGVKAGARSAMGSLWSIPDEASYELMKSFYENLKDTNMSRAQALQSAQETLLQNPKYAHPFNWSAFLMINNWL